MGKDIEIISGKYGKRAILRSPWKDEFARLILDKNVKELVLNGVKGWKGKHLDFLAQLPRLESLEIISSLANDTAVNELRELKALHIESPAKTAIDFANFPKIEEIAVYWRPKLKNLLNCPTVNRLFLYTYPGKAISDFAGLPKLRCLSLKNSRSLEQLGDTTGMAKLEFLGIYLAPRLTSLASVENLVGLTTLEISTCRKIKSISQVSRLSNLRRFLFVNGGKIDSLKALRGLDRLEEFLFFESTNVADGDLSVLEELPKLREVAFQQRRHYNRSWDDFPSTRE